ncbi:MAG: N-6 DNA methylase [Erysipelotrichaceae bacterium]|nr:N-6 DNA methylase [Erysipelotrichaceae bacterium]
MADIVQLERDIKEIIDELKGICQTAGLTGSAAEEVVITSTFLYKFLNDKFMWNLDKLAEKYKMTREELLNDNDALDSFYHTYAEDVAFTKEDTITYLATKVNEQRFYEVFDNALERISNNPRNEVFSVETADGGRKPLFTRITENVEASKRNNFAVSLFGVISKKKFDFGDAFENNFDFYSTIFEYLIKDYNVASGTYAEYFTPQAVSSIIAKILVRMSPIRDTLYEVYDPSAGSGSLVLHLANELGDGSFGNKARVYTQDISQKSTRFLRINMLLNGLTESLENIIEGDTLVSPAHFEEKDNPNSGLKHFDFITSNPPFKMDFSSTRDIIATKWSGSDRFKQGVPNIPANKKESMAIYLLFIQHILYSLKDEGKAAIVVPTGFLTAKKGIEPKIRKAIIDNQWLKGVISMPSNIFANTGTNVSVLFIDKGNKVIDGDEDSGKVILIDASKLGEKIKDGKNQRTVLRKGEIEKIENTFIERKENDDFSVLVTYDQIQEKGYSFSAGQYFEVKIEYVDISADEFQKRMDTYMSLLSQQFQKGKELEDSIMKQMGGLKL